MLFVCDNVYAKNLLSNPTFEFSSVNKGTQFETHQGLPRSWYYDGWNLNRENSYFKVEKTPLNKSRYKETLRIHHDQPAHSYLWQAFELKKNTIYRFTARVKVLSADTSTIAAALGVVDQNTSAKSNINTRSWQTLHYYINNAEEARSVKLMLSFGYYSNLNKGDVVFSDVSMIEVDMMPEKPGARSAHLVYGKPKYKIPEYYFSPPKNTFRIVFLLGTLGVLVVLTFAYCFFRLDHKNLRDDDCHVE